MSTDRANPNDDNPDVGDPAHAGRAGDTRERSTGDDHLSPRVEAESPKGETRPLPPGHPSLGMIDESGAHPWPDGSLGGRERRDFPPERKRDNGA